jgi:hypothetical protein
VTSDNIYQAAEDAYGRAHRLGASHGDCLAAAVDAARALLPAKDDLNDARIVADGGEWGREYHHTRRHWDNRRPMVGEDSCEAGCGWRDVWYGPIEPVTEDKP